MKCYVIKDEEEEEREKRKIRKYDESCDIINEGRARKLRKKIKKRSKNKKY